MNQENRHATSPTDLQAGLDSLAAAGLNLIAIFPLDELPSDVARVLSEENAAAPNHRHLVLMGHGGRSFWRTLQSREKRLRPASDPIDILSAELATTFACKTLKDSEWRLLYPGATRLPLQSLGAAAGWAHRSPLGLGIHATYGLWWAYRVALLTTQSLPRLILAPTSHPCHDCAAKPCLDACPAGALSPTATMDLAACSRHRLTKPSTCADRCLAREACPVGQAHRYGRDQIGYHYGHSLTTLKRYFSNG